MLLRMLFYSELNEGLCFLLPSCIRQSQTLLQTKLCSSHVAGVSHASKVQGSIKPSRVYCSCNIAMQSDSQWNAEGFDVSV